MGISHSWCVTLPSIACVWFNKNLRQVDGTLYCIHRYFFSRDSAYFNYKFTKLGVRDHEHLRTIISLDDIGRSDFEALLSVIYPK
jgi:hypothetical protein